MHHKLGNFLLPIGPSVVTNWRKFILLQLGVVSFYYKLGQLFLLQIGKSVITNWGSLIIINQGKFYYKSGQLLQISATVITNWGSCCKLGQTLLQIRAAITNWGITPWSLGGFF